MTDRVTVKSINKLTVKKVNDMQRLLRSLRSTSLAQCMLVLAQGLVRVLGALARLQVALPVNEDAEGNFERRTIMNYEANRIGGAKNTSSSLLGGQSRLCQNLSRKGHFFDKPSLGRT